MLSIVRHPFPDFGITYGPPGDGPFPAILILHGSDGGSSGWSHCHAILLAAHGFLTYPHVYSRDSNAWNAGSIRDVPLVKTMDALHALRASAYCSGKVGLYGRSRGAEHALLLTSLMAQDHEPGLPDAVAAHSSADVICGPFDAKHVGDQGEPSVQVREPAGRAWQWHGSSEALKPTTSIEIERYDGPIFLSHGTQDQIWDVAMTKRLEARLRSKGRLAEVYYYDGEGHSLGSAAQNQHYEHLIDFMRRHLAK